MAAKSQRLRLVYGDGEYEFALDKIGLVLELEEKCDTGVRVILHRLSADAWFISDVRETIRLGLIGGGMKPEDAFRLVKRYLDEDTKAGWAASVPIAQRILLAALLGVPDEPVGKPSAEGTETKAMAASSAPQS